MKLLFVLGLVCAVIVVPVSSRADEVRIGIMAHDVDIPEVTYRPLKEQSVSVAVEYIFDTPNLPKWTLGTRPYVYGSLNLEGMTSHAGAGLNFRQHFWDKFYAEFEGGLSIHNGTKRIEFPSLAERAGLSREQQIALLAPFIERGRTEIEFGSRALFRAQISIGYKFNETWGADIVYEHLSNGQILGGPENDYLDSVGFRISRNF